MEKSGRLRYPYLVEFLEANRARLRVLRHEHHGRLGLSYGTFQGFLKGRAPGRRISRNLSAGFGCDPELMEALCGRPTPGQVTQPFRADFDGSVTVYRGGQFCQAPSFALAWWGLGRGLKEVTLEEILR